MVSERHPNKETPASMSETAHDIERRIAKLRERMRGTLARAEQSVIREQIMEEMAKLKALGGIVEGDDVPRGPLRR